MLGGHHWGIVTSSHNTHELTATLDLRQVNRTSSLHGTRGVHKSPSPAKEILTVDGCCRWESQFSLVMWSMLS